MMYSSRPTIVYGFHGTDREVGTRILNRKNEFRPSENKYDWLGPGVYFWENNLERARQYAIEDSVRTQSTIKTPFVLGAIIELGECLDMLDQEWNDSLRNAYQRYEEVMEGKGETLPRNTNIGPSDTEYKARELDNAVIRYACSLAKQRGRPFDSVRSAFFEGEPLYKGSAFRSENHIQLAILNPDCIKGIFLPRETRAA